MKIMTKTEEKNLISSFNFDTEDYIRKNGLVTDKKVAIELLCQTNRAWKVLDESLKIDSEIIMYFQPSGLKEVTLSTPDSGDLIDLGIRFSGTIYYYESGFECMSSDELIQAGYIKPKCGLYDDSFLIPMIAFPEGFDYETYFRIQNELKEQNPYEENNNSLSVGTSTIINTFFTSIKTLGYGWNNGGTTKIYDRNLLKALVPSIYVKGTTKTIGVHPSMKSKTTSEN